MVNSCVEAWFEQKIGTSFGNMHLQRNIGVPTVQTDSRFVRPSRLEDKLILRLQLTKLTSKSITVMIKILGEDPDQGLGKDDLRAEFTVTLVLVDLVAMRSMLWEQHADINTALQQELEKLD